MEVEDEFRKEALAAQQRRIQRQHTEMRAELQVLRRKVVNFSALKLRAVEFWRKVRRKGGESHG